MKRLLIFQLIVFILVPLSNFIPNIFLDSPFADDPNTLIQPANYAFAIWGPIFLGMLIYSVFQLGKDRVHSFYLKKATWAAISAGLASIAFVPISYSDIQWLAFIDIIWHLISLIVLFINLREQIKLEHNPRTKWFYLPTQLYLGWISAATAVSFALLLRQTFGVDLPLEIEISITIGIISALTGVAILMNQIDGGVVSLVIVWALVGVSVANAGIEILQWASIGGIALITIVVILRLVKGKGLSYT